MVGPFQQATCRLSLTIAWKLINEVRDEIAEYANLGKHVGTKQRNRFQQFFNAHVRRAVT